MHIIVNNQRIEIEVSDSGVFYDKPFMKYHANTLNGLKNKIEAGEAPKERIPVIIEHSSSLRRGTVIGKGKAQYNRSFKIRWEDGKRSVVDISFLRKPTTPIQRVKLIELAEKAAEAEDASTIAQSAFDDYEDQFQVSQDLKQAFGS